jgi:hypothetical protein
MRNPGTGIASTVVSEHVDAQHELGRPESDSNHQLLVAAPSPQLPTAVLSSANASPASALNVVPAAPVTAPPPPPAPGPAHAPTVDSASPESGRRTPPGSTRVSVAQSSPPRRATTTAIRHSTMSVESGQTSSTKAHPQRKKSTLRGALSKLFGRKKKTNSQQDAASSNGKSTPGSGTQHQSIQAPASPDQKRSVSLPVSQYDRALRSHSVGPEDVLAIESARNSLNVDLSLSKRKTEIGHLIHARRATDSGWVGLSPRPASSQGRGSRLERHSSDPDDIGRAITCDATIAKRRRSRSLSGLPDLEEDHDDPRRRSDEIRYWRESYDPNFGAPLLLIPPSRDGTTVASPIEVPGTPPDEQATTPLQPFSFGSAVTMNEFAGMKITQAASMDTRIGYLETRMRRTENVVAQLCNAVPDFKPQIDARDQVDVANNTAASDSRPPTQPGPRYSDASRTLFGDGTYNGSVPHSSMLPPAMPFHRPMSIATIRGATSMPTIPRDSTIPFTMDHYVKLIEIVETERSARQVLETQVKMLNQEVSRLTRGSEQQGSHRLTGPPMGKSFIERSAFDYDDDDDASDTIHGRYRGSMMMEDSGIATGVTDDDDYSESFTTPHEEANGFQTIDSDEDDVAKRKAARTMSLSQLTLGKNGPRPANSLPQSTAP